MDVKVEDLIKTAKESTADLADMLSSSRSQEQEKTAEAIVFEKVAEDSKREEYAEKMASEYYEMGRNLARILFT